MPLLTRDDVPEHVRALTSREVLAVEADFVTRLIDRAEQPAAPTRLARDAARVVAGRGLDHAQRRVVAALAGTAALLVVEGAAGAGKTTTLAATRRAAGAGVPPAGGGDPDPEGGPGRPGPGRRRRVLGLVAGPPVRLSLGRRRPLDPPTPRPQGQPEGQPDRRARLLPGDVLLVDEAGMLDQDTARALLTIADEAGARIVFVGDRHQLPAVGRGGVLDLASRWVRPEAHLDLDTVHRFTDPDYADLSLLMRTGERSGEVFDALVARDGIVVHASEVERLAALSTVDGLVVADTREQVAA